MYPKTIEIEVSDIDSWNDNPGARHEDEEEIVYDYENATVVITASSEKEIEKWLKTRDDFISIDDYDFSDIDFEKATGTVTATAIKDDIDVGKK
jgi:transketolase